MENIVATHPLELVHIDYLCLKPRKGREENDCPSNGHSVVGQLYHSVWFAGQDFI